MKAAVIHGPKKITYDTVDDPTLKDPRDIILKVTATAICGSDLRIYTGGIPQPRPMVLGHEFMGIVEEVGKGITHLKQADRVVVPFPIACGHCFFCNHELPGHREHSNPEHYGPEGGLLTQKGGALFGYTDLYGGYDGGQAQYVRVPYADIGPRKVPDNLTDEQVLFLTDIFPTGYTGIDWGKQRLPTLEDLSFEYDVSTDTIAKSYIELKLRGFIVSHPGKGYYITKFSAIGSAN